MFADGRDVLNAPVADRVYELVEVDADDLCIRATGARLQSGYLTNTAANNYVVDRIKST